MKKSLFTLLAFLLSAAQADEIKCPGYYPAKPTRLTEVPAGQEGNGIVRPGKLSSAYIHVGDLHADPNGFAAMQSVPKRVKGGWDTDTFFSADEAKWLVCVYGGEGRLSVQNPRVTGSTEWWGKIGPNIRHCALHFREVKGFAGSSSDWSATAVCE